MSELKATPGPWRKVNRNVNEMMMTFHGVLIGDVFVDVPTSNEKPDAHLIAAAPELYEALDKLKLSYEALAHDYEYAVGAGDIHPLHAEHIQRCAAVLAKARGEQP